jgi:hypothetical protein
MLFQKTSNIAREKQVIQLKYVFEEPLYQAWFEIVKW